MITNSSSSSICQDERRWGRGWGREGEGEEKKGGMEGRSGEGDVEMNGGVMMDVKGGWRCREGVGGMEGGDVGE